MAAAAAAATTIAQATPITMAPAGEADGSRDSSGGTGEERLPMPSRNPLPLSASQEAQVREVFNARVRAHCADDIKAFAECARGRTFSIPFSCRALSHAMNSCMQAHATPAEHDRAREDWFAARMTRARERERRERRKLEQERFHREWWGLPERDPDQLRAELERLERPERIGGAVRRRGDPTSTSTSTSTAAAAAAAAPTTTTATSGSEGGAKGGEGR